MTIKSCVDMVSKLRVGGCASGFGKWFGGEFKWSCADKWRDVDIAVEEVSDASRASSSAMLMSSTRSILPTVYPSRVPC